MEWSLNSLSEIVPLPILIGMLIWTISMCLFSLFLILILILLNQRSSKFAELISIKELSNEQRDLKSGFSCDSLSLISYKTTRKDIEEPANSFYLGNSFYLKDKEIINSLPPIKLRSNQINTLPQLSKRRSIIRDLTSLSNSLKQSKMNQSFESIFSKDSLVE